MTGQKNLFSANGAEGYDPWFTYGNPAGKVLRDQSKRKAVGGKVESNSSSRWMSGFGRSAGVQSGENADKRGRANVQASVKYTNGNTMVDTVIEQSKFTYHNFQR